jgi:anaerobic ribonucleoside-triphosphate reductase
MKHAVAHLPGEIVKRNGLRVPFEKEKIVVAIAKAGNATGELDASMAAVLAEEVLSLITVPVPSVEHVQDLVEHVLMRQYGATAKAYILYRAERAENRQEFGRVPEHVRALSEESKKYFTGNPLGEFVYLRTYARWIEEEGRRETWVETVDRYLAFMRENLNDALTDYEYEEVRHAILTR